MSHEVSACGVGLIANRHGHASHEILQNTLNALTRVEHRGGTLADGITGDGSGIMTDIPFELFGYQPGSVAVATLFVLTPTEDKERALRVFEETFKARRLDVIAYRPVPTCREVLGPAAESNAPTILHAFIRWPARCRTPASFNRQLYLARQRVRTAMREAGIVHQFYFTSLSSKTIVYKALTRAHELAEFYPDLKNTSFKTRFGIFHRRFSTNTRTTWDKAQPFRLLAHNGEINTIAANHRSAYAHEQALGLAPDELLSHENASDSNLLNGMLEALKYRSSIPHTEEALALVIPPALDFKKNGEAESPTDPRQNYYRFWGRAVEAWDGPAFVAYSDGRTAGARLDRNGFRPGRWALTSDHFCLASEAGVFDLAEQDILSKGSLRPSSGVMIELESGKVFFRDPAESTENQDAVFSTRLQRLESALDDVPANSVWTHKQIGLLGLNEEDWKRVIKPMIQTGEEPIGSMGNTARPAILSNETRSFFDYFFQSFAQVTNPPFDVLREKNVLDFEVYLGKQPNIFLPKELVPPPPAILLDSPVLSRTQLDRLFENKGTTQINGIQTAFLDATFLLASGVEGARTRLRQLGQEALEAVREGNRVLLITDRACGLDRTALPSLLALRSICGALVSEGRSLECSLVIAMADVQNSHHIASLIAFGADAVCPVLPLELAADEKLCTGIELTPSQREQNLLRALEKGLLKVMSKMGISVVRSYKGSQLFTPLGLSQNLLDDFFPGFTSPIGGLSLDDILGQCLHVHTQASESPDSMRPSGYQFKEHPRDAGGEKHSMSAKRSRALHALTTPQQSSTEENAYADYLEHGKKHAPLAIRDLLTVNSARPPCTLAAVESVQEITKRFCSGAMSFGAISAEAQRDIVLAMREIGGKSNSGEGGENPYYESAGIHASIKQVASGRFGVSANYLAASEEIEIKIAQGAKPGEGGQLMSAKVDASIAKARHATPGMDLISPPPMHDIYSIEDLKQLIFELKELFPKKPVGVKLVSGRNIGTIAAGVVKAGADVVHISGGDGGTGAATLLSMRHAGLPWEIALAEVHRQLCEQGLRQGVRLRVDGGLSSGEDIIKAAILGADEFAFGKLLLIAEGCIMARVCEKNSCPRGIATHDPKFKSKYRGSVSDIVKVMQAIAQDVRNQLAQFGCSSLQQLIGRFDLLSESPQHIVLIQTRGLEFSELLRMPSPPPNIVGQPTSHQAQGPSQSLGSNLNQRIMGELRTQWAVGDVHPLRYSIQSTDRAVLTRLCGELAGRRALRHLNQLTYVHANTQTTPDGNSGNDSIELQFEGSAGQGFAAFLVSGVSVTLEGECNDSVGKSMSGGRIVLRPATEAKQLEEGSTIAGNTVLYGATGGLFFARGQVGDRFAVRNSGAVAVVEGAGLHACEYMTGGTVAVLGPLQANVGAGMTGGTLFCLRAFQHQVNQTYLQLADLNTEDDKTLTSLLKQHFELTNSKLAKDLLRSKQLHEHFIVCRPRCRRGNAT